MSRRPSLTFQVLAGVGIPFLAVTCMIGILAWFSAEDEISEVYDAQLMNSAVQLWSMARTTDEPGLQNLDRRELGLNADDQGDLEEYAHGRAYRVWKAGHLDMASPNAPPPTEPPLPKGLHTVGTGRHVWRTFTLVGSSSNIVVEVRERLHARHEVSDRIVWDLLWPLLMILPVIGVATWAGIRWGLKDLRGFARAVHERSPNDLARLDQTRVPTELTPLSDSINGLFGKLESSLAQQRLFTDNAAHELRTPLAALTVQIDVARNARSAKERDTTFEELSQGVRRASRLLDQMLTLARLQHTTEASLPVNLYAAASEVMKDAYAKANLRKVDLALSGDIAVVTRAQPMLLALLIGNLVDNAVKYSPEGGSVDIHVATDGEEARLTLCDQGPGIPESERERVFARFYRIPGNTTPGSGLGLSIVRVIADLLEAKITLFTPKGGRGLGVEVRLKQ